MRQALQRLPRIMILNGFTFIEMLLALSLSTVLLISLFQCTLTMEALYQKQQQLSALLNNRRYLTRFLREKIHQADGHRCASSAPDKVPIAYYADMEAKTRFHIVIKPRSALLALQTCIHFQNHWQYLPVYFFVMPTRRMDSHHHPIEALYMKIDTHPSEELVTNVSDFQIALQTSSKGWLAKIAYVLCNQSGVL